MMVANIYTHNVVEVAERLIAVLEGSQEALELARVYYGRTNKIPDYPAVCVEAGTKTRQLSGEGASRRFAVDLSAEIYVYFGTVDIAEANARANELLTEAIEETIHEDFNLGGAVIFGYVARVEPGVSVRGDTMVKVSRLTYTARSRQTF